MARRMSIQRTKRRQRQWEEIREPGTNRLLFKYDPQRRLIEIQRRRRKTVVDLKRLDGEE